MYKTLKTGLIYPALLFTVFIGLFVAPAFADLNVNGEVTDSYKTIVNKSPYSVEVCSDVHVPGDKSSDMLTGAIIGGIIGNNVTIAGKSGVTKNIPDNKVVAGFPAKDINLWKKEVIKSSIKK